LHPGTKWETKNIRRITKVNYIKPLGARRKELKGKRVKKI